MYRIAEKANHQILPYVMVAAVLTLMIFFGGTAHTFAAAPIVTIEDLETQLDGNGGTLPAYMKTVLKGATVVQIDLEIIGITSSSSYMPSGFNSLILFRSDDIRLTRIGGIAMGMSGSPIYLGEGSNPQPTDPLIGALSYGEEMTLDNFGLATPIEAMRSIKTYPMTFVESSMLMLDEPVYAADGTQKTRIIIADTSEGSAVDAGSDAIVVTPMKVLSVSGINPNSAYGKAYAKYLNSKGIRIIGQGGGVGTTATYNAPFEEGGSVAALLASGDFSAGAVGTVTEVADGGVLAFGHPFMWSGESNIIMSNAWVDAVWPSAYGPYKMARPATDRGTIVQDRAAGVYGIDGILPECATITAKVTNEDTGIVGESKTRIPRFVMDSDDYWYYGLSQYAVYIAACKAVDSETVRGSVASTTTVTIRDGSELHTVVLDNLWYSNDSEMDVTALAINDLSTIIYEVASVYSNDKHLPQITDIQFEASYTSAKHYGKVVDVLVPATGLIKGKNSLQVKVERPGTFPDVMVPVEITIPSNFSLSGVLTVLGIGDEWYGDYCYDEYFDEDYDFRAADERTVPEMVADIKKREPNNKFVVMYRDVQGRKAEASSQLLEYVALGEMRKETVNLKITRSSVATIPYKGTARITGTLRALNGKGKLELWKKEGTAKSYVFVKNIPFTLKYAYDDEAYAEFSTSVSGLTKNTSYQIRYSGSRYELSAASNVLSQKVRAGLTLQASKAAQKIGATTTYTATVAPKGSKGKVVFQYHNGKKWVDFATKTVNSAGKASASRKSNVVGTLKVRARFTPSSATPNAASTWVARNVRYSR